MAQLGVIRCCCVQGAQLLHGDSRDLLPVRVQPTHGRIRDEQANEVALRFGDDGKVRDHGCGQVIPRQDLRPGPHDENRRHVQVVDEGLHQGQLLCVVNGRRGCGCLRCESGNCAYVIGGGGIELQGIGHGSQHGGRGLDPALFQPRVVVRADGRHLCHFFAAQAGHSASLGGGDDSELSCPQAGAPSSEEITQ